MFRHASFRHTLLHSLVSRWTLATLLVLGLPTAIVAGGDGSADQPTDPKPLVAGFLLVDGVYNTELTAPWDVLQHTRYHVRGEPWIDVVSISPDGRPVTTAEGLRLTPDFGFADAPALDILVVPSAQGSRGTDLENRELVEWVRRVGSDARFVVSLCWGAFVLAEADLLDGRSATTFPSDYESFARRFPGIDLQVNVSFVHDGPALTSQGGARSFDVAMYLVAHLYGNEVARGIGGGLLLPWPPDPGLVPYISPALPPTADESAP